MLREFSSHTQPQLELLWGCSHQDEELFEWMLAWVHTFWTSAEKAGWKCQLTHWQGEWLSQTSPTCLATAEIQLSPTPPPAHQLRLTFWLGGLAAAKADFHFAPGAIQVGEEPFQCLPG